MNDPLVTAFEDLVSRRGSAPAAVCPGRRAVTISALDALARDVASRLVSARLAPATLVGLAAPNGAAFLASVIALRRSGLSALLLDPQGPTSDLRRTAVALGASLLMSCEDAWPSDGDAWSLTALLAPLDPLTLPPSTAFVKLTSGSTGSPRGVAVTAEAVMTDEAGLTSTMKIRDGDRIVAAIPLSHAYGFTVAALPILVRGCVLVVPAASGPLSPLVAAAEAGATVYPTVPAYLQALLKMSQPPPWPESIRTVMTAGAPLAPETARQFRQTYGQPVHAFYGATECGGICYDREGDAGERGTVGTPVEGVTVALEALSGESGAEEGIVTITSRAAGETYVPDPDPRLGHGRFQTNDIGRWVNGELQLLRRTDALINVKGKKVDPFEIETALAGLAAVEEVVALGIPAPQDGGQMVRVVIACRPGRLTYEDVLSFCRSRLADHKVPRSILLVPEIPRTPRGKIDRGALTALRPADLPHDHPSG